MNGATVEIGQGHGTASGAIVATSVDYLVERYWPGIDDALLESVLSRLQLAARAMTKEGFPVQHVGTLFMTADQVVFSVIRAGSEALVGQLNERAQLPVDRIAEVTVHGFDAGSRADSAGATGPCDTQRRRRSFRRTGCRRRHR